MAKKNAREKLMQELLAPEYRLKCEYAIHIIELKLEMLMEQFYVECGRPVISSITSRIKSVDSIERKLRKKKLSIDFATAEGKLSDLVGVRATCFFEDDVYKLAERLLAQEDVTLVRKKDYIKKPKANGYHSLHLTVEVPIYTQEGCEKKRVEIQFRTVAMDFWAQLDYQLCYKKNIEERTSKKIQEKLAKYADEMAGIDRQMMRLRRQIDKLGTDPKPLEPQEEA